jgi:tripartite ATP-independent transporter DctM subunit
MRKDGYRPDFSAAVTAASSTIGPIIPPSVPLVVYGVMAQVSVGQLFLGGLLPGVLLGLVMMGVVVIKARRENYRTHPRASFQTVWREFLSSSLSLLAPIIILGGIFSGAFTPTEAGVVASVYALFLGFVYRTIKPRELWAVIEEAMLTTAQITFIVGAAGLFGWVITRAQIPASISSFLIALTNDKNIVLLLINFVMVFMGCFIDALALLIMMTPVVFPLGMAFNIDPVQLGLILVLNCMIGLITPPVGLCLYIVSNTAKVPIFKVARALIPFYIALAVCLVLIIFIPQIVTFLPNLIKL